MLTFHVQGELDRTDFQQIQITGIYHGGLQCFGSIWVQNNRISSALGISCDTTAQQT
jgi:hypothetical protein